MTDVITSDNIASVSLKDADRDPKAFSDELGQSFVDYGFAIVRQHGIPQEPIERAEKLSKQFFALPEEVKRKYLIPGSGGARGYTAFGVETAKGAQAFDLKEFWHVGRELSAGHPFRDVMADNIWPAEIEGFKETYLALYDEFDEAGLKVLRAIARFLVVDEEYFTDTVRDGNSVMRLLHYPAQDEPTGNHIRAGAHEDINTITLLLGAEEAGLELKTGTAAGSRSRPKEGELVINIGDMLQRLTNGLLRSTSHRVVNPAPDRASHARYSMPYFLHFRSDFIIEALPSTVPAGEEPKWPPISSHEYLQERLREIKLK